MKVLLAFKNPSRPLNDTFETECPLDASIGELKDTLQGVYPGNPAPEAITLIYAGKVLKDNAMPLSAFISSETPSPVAIHIVVKGATPSSFSATAQAERPNSAASSTTRASSREEVVGQAAAPIEPEAARAVPFVPEPTYNAPPPPAAAVPIAIPVPAAAEPRENVQVAQPTEAATASTSKQSVADGPQPIPPPPAAAAGSQEQAAPPSFPPGMEAFYSNQMAYGVAYQAAYQAALQSILAVQQQQQQQNNNIDNKNQQQPIPTTGQMFYPMPIPMPFAPPQPYYYNYNYPMMPPPQQQQHNHNHPDGNEEMRLRRRAVVAAILLNATGGPEARSAEDILRMLRELRSRGFQLPPEVVAAMDRVEAAAAGQGAGGGAAVRPRVHRFQLRIRVNIRVLLQLAIMLVVVYQHCPPKRFAVLCLLGFAMWLSTLPRVRAFLQSIAGLGPNNNRRGEVPVPAPQPGAMDGQPAPAAAPAGAAEAAPVEGAPENIDAAARVENNNNNPPLDPQQLPEQQQPRAVPGAGIIREIHAFIAGFITSLLPAMDHHNNNNEEANAAGAGGAGAMRDVFGGEQ